jgi:hypothetical protein
MSTVNRGKERLLLPRSGKSLIVTIIILTLGILSGSAATAATPTRRLLSGTLSDPPRASVQGSRSFGGYSSVGKLFFTSPIGDQSCTASVINNTKPPRGGTMLMITAAHCVTGTFARVPYADKDFVFAPAWVRGKAPYGRWSVSTVLVSAKWLECPVPVADCHTDAIYDYAIMILRPSHGRHIGAVTGGDGIAWNQGKKLRSIRIVGYTDGHSEPQYAITNTATITKHGQSFRQGNASGQGDGTSGGPWFTSAVTDGVGLLAGDTGGFQQGGPASGNPTYSDVWNNDFYALVAAAAKLAVPGQAGQVSAAGLRQHGRKAGCMKIDVYTYSQASGQEALRYWTPVRMRSARGVSSSGASTPRILLRADRASSRAGPTELCVPVPVTRTDQTRPTLPQTAKSSHG